MPHEDSTSTVAPEGNVRRATADRTPEDVDVLFSALADRRRRLLLERVAEPPDPVVVEELVRHVVGREDGTTTDLSAEDRRARIAVSLYHKHIPTLETAGVIDVDRGTNTVRRDDGFDAATTLLEVV